MWYVLENEELNRDISRKVDGKWSTREAVDTFNSRFHHNIVLVTRKDAILVVYDRMSKMAYFVTITEGT